MTIPIPAMKPDGNGGYSFCPRCAIMWVIIAAAVVAAILIVRKVKQHEN